MRLRDSDRARENLDRHAWAQELVSSWKRDVAYAMAQDRDVLEAMLPELTSWPEYGQNCPACVGRLSSMGETGLYTWDVRDPDRLVCKYCGTEYPNARYPEDGRISAPRMGQTFSFYLTEAERAHPDDRSGKHAFQWTRWPVHTSWTGVLRSKKSRWCLDQMVRLADLYALSGEVDYALRAAWIMDALARRYPNWLFHSYDGTYADCPPAEAAVSLGAHPRGGRFPVEVIVTAFEGRHREGDHAVLHNGFWGAGRFGCSGSDGGMLLKVALAYDAIRDARHADGSPVITPAMDRRIVRDLILPGCEDTENWNEINNKCGPGRALSAAVGILFDRPASIRRAVEGFEALLEKSFHFDGFCEETPGYSNMHLNLMRDIPELLAGWTGADGEQDLDPFRRFDRYRLALESMVRQLDPNLEYPVIGDSRKGSTISPIYAEVLAAHYGNRYAAILERTQGAPLSERGSEYALWHRHPDLAVEHDADLPHRTEWFPGWHVAVLRGGETPTDTAFYLNGAGFGIHRHYDTLGIIYIAQGRERVTDRGYIWDDPRNAWTKSTLAHNIVVVDEENQPGDETPARLELFGRGAGIEVVQASAAQYPQCDRYQRTCVLVQIPGGTYVVDLFRVRGGRNHRYVFHADGSLEDLVGADLHASEIGIEWMENIREDHPETPLTATWRDGDLRLDLHLLTSIDRLIVADAPGWRSDSGEELHAPPIQQILAERTAGTDLASQYAAVITPYAGRQAPTRAARLLLDDPDTGALAVAVERDGATDYVVSSPNDGHYDVGPLSLTGRFAFASLDSKGDLLRASLIDGVELRAGGRTLSLPRGRTVCRVASTEDRTYRLADDLPDIPGAYLLAGDTGYDIESTTPRSITVRDYPAVACETVALLHAADYE